jgi:hypothetical protein
LAAIIREFSILPDTICCIFRKHSLYYNAKPSVPLGKFTVFSLIIAYTIGFILLSYFSLDGYFRIYMLFVSLAGYFLVSKAAFRITHFIFCITLKVLLFPFAKIWRKNEH